MILNNHIDMAMRAYKGGKPGDPPPPPPPPSPTTAAEVVARQMREARRKSAMGFAQTILTGPQGVQGYPGVQAPAKPPTVLKQILGE